MSLGPNSGVGSGSLLVLIERQIEYAIEAAKKLQRERLKSIEVKKHALDDYDAYLDVSLNSPICEDNTLLKLATLSVLFSQSRFCSSSQEP